MTMFFHKTEVSFFHSIGPKIGTSVAPPSRESTDHSLNQSEPPLYEWAGHDHFVTVCSAVTERNIPGLRCYSYCRPLYLESIQLNSFTSAVDPAATINQIFHAKYTIHTSRESGLQYTIK